MAHSGCMQLEDHSPRQACRFIARHNVFSPSGSRHTREDTVLWLPSLRPHCSPAFVGRQWGQVLVRTFTDRSACVVGGVRRSCPTSEYIVPAPAVSLLPEDDCQMAALARCFSLLDYQALPSAWRREAVIHLFGGLGFSAADLAGGLRDADSRALCSRP